MTITNTAQLDVDNQFIYQDIPTSILESHYSQTTVLDGVQYLLEFDWVQRLQRWTLSLFLADQTPLVQGMVLAPNIDLLECYRYDDRIPQGLLFISDLQNIGGTPALDDFGIGREYTLQYVTTPER